MHSQHRVSVTEGKRKYQRNLYEEGSLNKLEIRTSYYKVNNIKGISIHSVYTEVPNELSEKR